jgi:nucleotide-binding universal stress UspA family protein
MQPFRTILFAADFSANAQEAFRAACSLAVENNSKLIVLHVVDRKWATDERACAGQPGDRRHENLKSKLTDVYAPGCPIEVTYCVREGDASAEILHMAEEINSDFIVLGTHGNTALRRLLAGSVATSVLRGAHCAIMALRPHVRPIEVEDLRVILHPTDFSDGSEAALQVARSVARDRGSRLIVLHVAPLEVFVGGTMTTALDLSDCHDALAKVRERIDGPDLKYPVETWFTRGQAPEEIVRVADEVGCDLIVMGTHGRTGLGRLLMGNTAESVLPEANCPVMIVKASKQAPAPAPGLPAEKMVTAV